MTDRRQPTSSAPPGDLPSILRDVVAAVETLDSALDREREALARRDIEALNESTTEKTALVSLIEQQQRLLGAVPLAERIAELPPASREACDELHKALEDALERCRHKNTVNGKVIGRSQQSTAALLRTIAGSESGAVYDRKGRSQPGAEGNDIARA